MMYRHASLLSFGLLAACGEPAAMAPMTDATGTTTETPGPRCGDGIADDGEVCFKVERLQTVISPEMMEPGDFNGDGKRDYYADFGGLDGDYAILGQASQSLPALHEGRFAGEGGHDHAVYRTSARDIDGDGLTDLMAWMQYNYQSVDVLTWALGAIVMRTRPGYQFDYELYLFWEADIGYKDPPAHFDGAFGDFDGDGTPEVVFAPNLHRASVWYVEPDAEPGQLFRLDYHLNLEAFAAQENIVTVTVDLDDNGRDDLVLVDGVGRVWTLYSDPQGVLVPRTLTDTPVLPTGTTTVLARDVDGDGIVDLIGATTLRRKGKVLPSELAIARGDGLGGFTQAAAWTAPVGLTMSTTHWSPATAYPHLLLLDLDASGYPALVYALREARTLVIHPQVGRTLGAETVEFPLDLTPGGVFADPQDDGTVDLLVSLYREESEDRGPFIDRYRIDP